VVSGAEARPQAAEPRGRDAASRTTHPLTARGKDRGTIAVPFLSQRDAIDRRRSLPIHAYVGPNGHFKTATMIRDTIPSLRQGRPCLSTVAILGPDGNPHPLYIPFTHWDQLRTFEFGDLILDEIVGVASSRDSGLPPDIQNVLMQLRRRDVNMRWTAPDYARAEKLIREVSQGISVCHGYAPDRKALKVPDAEGRIRSWAPNRLASVITYDGKDMAAFNSSETSRSRLKPRIREWYWAPKTGVFEAYDTYAGVTQVSYMCPVCGKKPVTPTCRGNHTPEEFAASESAPRAVMVHADQHIHD
jgi:hypothetical protein